MSVYVYSRKGFLFLVVLLVLCAVVVFLMREAAEDHAELIESVPEDAVAVMHLSDVARLGEKLDVGLNRLGLERHVGRLLRDMERQLGFDPFDEDALRSRGIQTSAGVALYAPPPGRQGVVILGIRDRGLFESALIEVLSARTGAELGEEREHAGVAVRVAEVRGRAVVAWAYAGDVVLLSAGPRAVERVGAGALVQDGSVRENVWFRRGEEAVWDDADVRLWTSNEGGRYLSHPLSRALEAVAVGLRFSEDGVSGRVWGGMESPARGMLEPLEEAGGVEERLKMLDSEAIVAGRANVDLAAAWRVARLGGLPRHLEELSAQLTARGLRVERDVLPLLEGVFLMDAGMAGRDHPFDIGRLDPRRLNPFLYIRAAVLAPLVDVERAEELMPKVAPAVAKAVRGRLEKVEIDGHEAYEIHYHLGRGMTFGISHGMLVATGGSGAYAAALERLEGQGRLALIDDPVVADRFSEQGSLALLLDIPNLISNVEDLPAESFGGGPTGMMVRSAVERLLGPVGNLTRVAASLSVDDHGVVGDLTIGFHPLEAEASGK